MENNHYLLLLVALFPNNLDLQMKSFSKLGFNGGRMREICMSGLEEGFARVTWRIYSPKCKLGKEYGVAKQCRLQAYFGRTYKICVGI
jgi:hypothetical protein